MTFPCQDAKSQPVLRYRLTHAATGEHIEDTMPLLITQPTPQGMGSALTYARRYSLCAVLNLVADADDDGQAAKPAKAKGEGQAGVTAARRQRCPAKKIMALLTRHRHAAARAATHGPAVGEVELGEGWMDRLSGGRDGTASLLIDLLEERKARSSANRTCRRTSDDLGQDRHADAFASEAAGYLSVCSLALPQFHLLCCGLSNGRLRRFYVASKPYPERFSARSSALLADFYRSLDTE